MRATQLLGVRIRAHDILLSQSARKIPGKYSIELYHGIVHQKRWELARRSTNPVAGNSGVEK